MRQLPAGIRAPAAVNKYLLPNEDTFITVRQHPAAVIEPSAVTLIGLVIAGVLSGTVVHGVLEFVVWIAWGLLLLRLIWKVTNWAVDYFVVTSERLLLTTGFLTRRINMMPLTKVTEMSFKRSLAGRLLGYGEFVVESAGPEQPLGNVKYIPYPEQFYLQICERLFPSSAEDSDDDRRPSAAVPDEL